MQRSIAIGLFVILLILGMAFVIPGDITFIYVGMVLIGVGVLNLAYNITFTKQPKRVELKIVNISTKKKSVKKKKTKRKKAKPKKKIVRKKKR